MELLVRLLLRWPTLAAVAAVIWAGVLVKWGII